MYDISQNPFCLYSVHRTSVSGERSMANGPLVFNLALFPLCQVLTLSQMTNFRLFQTESLQTTISTLIKMAESFPNG